MDITDIFNIIRLCDKNAPWVYCHIVERISSAIWVSSGPKAAINIKWNRDEEENLNAVAEESDLFLESLKLYVIVHAKIQMDCGFFFARLVNYSIQYANVSCNYILQRTLSLDWQL